MTTNGKQQHLSNTHAAQCNWNNKLEQIFACNTDSVSKNDAFIVLNRSWHSTVSLCFGLIFQLICCTLQYWSAVCFSSRLTITKHWTLIWIWHHLIFCNWKWFKVDRWAACGKIQQTLRCGAEYMGCIIQRMTYTEYQWMRNSYIYPH